MYSQEIKALMESRKATLDGAGAILAKAKAENRPLTDAERQEFDRRHAEGKANLADIERLQAQAAEEQRMTELAPDTRAAGREPLSQTSAQPSEAESRDAFRHYLRSGPAGLSPLQRSALTMDTRALSDVTGAQGAFTVPQGFEKDLILATLAIGPYLKYVDRVETTSGNPLPWPSANDTANRATIVGEGTQIASTGFDPAFGQVVLSAYMYTSGIVLVPLTLINDSAFPIDDYLNKMFATRFARGLNADCTVGTGTNQPAGIVGTASLAATTATNSAVAYTDLVNTFHGLDPSYRGQATWMFHDATLEAIQRLTDSNGRPLFSPGGVTSDLSKAPADTILGRPYVINQSMPVIGSLAKFAIFGDLKNYKLRSVRGVQVMRLTERYADYLQVGFMAFQRNDGKLVDPGTHPVVYLACPT